MQLLSFQTFNESGFTNNVDPEVEVANPPWQNVNVPAVKPTTNEPAAIEVSPVQIKAKQPELTDGKTKGLANACGNCALAYNFPNLVCAVTNESTQVLNTCDSYLSPLDLLKAR